MEINGQKIKLRDWQEKDLETYRYFCQPEHEWHKYNGPYYPKQTKQKVEESLKKIHEKIQADVFERPREELVIADIENDKLVGLVSSYWQSKETDWLQVGIGIYDENLWGKGIGLEAMSLWIDYLFEAYPHFVRLGFMTWSGNIGMIKVGQKLGMKEEARFRKARIVNGEYFDSVGYGVLREDWKKRRLNVDLKSELIKLEMELHTKEVRANYSRLDELLDDSFFEIGTSGNYYLKEDTIKLLPEERFVELDAFDFDIREIQAGVTQIVYKTKVEDKKSFRSSIWIQSDSGWKMIFHQGTKLV